MLPLLPFALGILAGGLAVRTLRDGRLRDGLKRAQDGVRSATVSSLTAVENSAQAIKQRLEPAPADAPEAVGAESASHAAPAPKPRKKRGATSAAAQPAPRRPARRAKAAPDGGTAA